MIDFADSLNAISTTKKDAIKSLAILLFKLHDAHMNDIDIELSVKNENTGLKYGSGVKY
jgi:hypothetical protein